MEVGSLAEWASAAGSVLAVITALYLSGSAKREAKRSQRPEIFCQVETSDRAAGFIEVRLRIENHSVKEWQVTGVSLLKPNTQSLTDERECELKDDLGGYIFSPEAIQEHQASVIRLNAFLKPRGSIGGGAGIPNHRTDLMSRRFLLPEPQLNDGFELRVDLTSLEPVPDSFAVKIRRSPPWH